MNPVLDRLLVTLEVPLEAFALIDLYRGHRLTFEPLQSVIVHYVLSGRGWLDMPNGEATPFQAGTIIVLPAGAGQSLRIDEGPHRELNAADHCMMTRGGLLRFDATGGQGAPEMQLLCGSIMPTAAGSFGLFDGLRSPLVEPFDDAPAIAEAFRLLQVEVTTPGLGTRALAGAVMKLGLVLLVRRHLDRLAAESPLLASLGDTRLTRAVSAVLEAPAEPHTVASLAQAAGMSRSAFAVAFRRAFGASPMEFVAKTRLHHAAELLRGTDLPTKIIAASIGFASRSHFSRAFRNAYGQDPRSYRRDGAAPVAAPKALHGSRQKFALTPEDGEAN